MMLLKIAWRNLWRNKRRSIIILTSVAVGVACIMLNDSLGRGMMEQMLENQIRSNVSHIQIHKAGFNDNKIIQSYVPNHQEVENILENSSFVKFYSKRVVSAGLLSSANASSGIVLMGIESDKEKNITSINSKIVEGRYLSGKSNEIVIGKEMAEKLEVELGDKVVAVASSLDGSVSTELFRVVGIYKSSSSAFDKIYAYISLSNAQKMLNLQDNFSEFAIIVEKPKATDNYKDTLFKKIYSKGFEKEIEILTYKDLLPLMIMYIDLYDQMIIVFYMIIIIAILFGVINVMLMSVYERIREIGVLMSIGMKSRRIFAMILLEAFVLGLVGSIMGFGLGFLAFIPLSNGLDLSIFARSLASMGIDTVIYPIINFNVVLNSILLMPLSTVVGACYPALRAIKLQPTDAMRHI